MGEHGIGVDDALAIERARTQAKVDRLRALVAGDLAVREKQRPLTRRESSESPEADDAPKGKQITLRVSGEHLQTAGQLVEWLENKPYIQELGTHISRSDVLRMAMERGLRTLLDEMSNDAAGPPVDTLVAGLGTAAIPASSTANVRMTAEAAMMVHEVIFDSDALSLVEVVAVSSSALSATGAAISCQPRLYSSRVESPPSPRSSASRGARFTVNSRIPPSIRPSGLTKSRSKTWVSLVRALSCQRARQ